MASKEKKKLNKLKNKYEGGTTTKFAHLNRFNFYDQEKGELVDPIDGADLPPKLTKKEKLQVFKELC